METIKLSKPLKVNGKEYKELSYDVDAVGVDDFATAETRAEQKKGNNAGIAESDYTFHLYLGMDAITKAMPEVDIADLERLTGRDIMRVMGIGRSFLFEQGVTDSAASSSDEQSESTPAPTGAARTK